MQCPIFKDDRNLMFNELREIVDVHKLAVVEDTLGTSFSVEGSYLILSTIHVTNVTFSKIGVFLC